MNSRLSKLSQIDQNVHDINVTLHSFIGAMAVHRSTKRMYTNIVHRAYVEHARCATTSHSTTPVIEPVRVSAPSCSVAVSQHLHEMEEGIKSLSFHGTIPEASSGVRTRIPKCIELSVGCRVWRRFYVFIADSVAISAIRAF
jgi:hypothetical protein